MKKSNRRASVFKYVIIAEVILSWAVPQVYAEVPLGEILLLGDSITYGSSTPSEVPGGYRGRLNTNLKDAGYSFQFVGSQTGNPSGQLTADGQAHHEGYGSYQVDMIANNLDANNQPPGLPGNNGGYWLTGTGGRGPIYPSYVLLHIGTNDILQNNDVGTGGADTSRLQARLESLITQIVTLRPNANVIVSTLIPINTNEAKYQILNYNGAIKNTIVPDFIAQGKYVTYVDNYQNFVDQFGEVITPSILSQDGLHPTQEGYNLMGDTWTAGIQAAPIIPEPGDFNGDLVIDLLDFNIMKNQWLTTGNGLNVNGDLTGPLGFPDGVIDLYDFDEFSKNIFPGGASAFASALEASSVPEPNAFMLLLAAAPAFLFFDKKRRSSRPFDRLQ